jgi:hypothetical protein
MRTKFFFMTILLTVFGSCGKEGIQREAKKAPAFPASPGIDNANLNPNLGEALDTHVIMADTSSPMPAPLACRDTQALTEIAPIPKDFTPDGTLSEWAALTPAGTDAAGDTRSGTDLLETYLSFDGKRLALALRTSAPLAGHEKLLLRFGGLALRSDGFHQESLRVFRVEENQLLEDVQGTWMPVGSPHYLSVTGQHGAEMVFTRQGLGEVLSWPAWTLETQLLNAEGVQDTTSLIAMPGVIQDTQATFSFQRCALRGGNQALRVNELRQAFSSTIQTTSTPNFATLAERAAGYVRLGLTHAGALFSSTPFPRDSLTLVLSEYSASTPPPSMNDETIALALNVRDALSTTATRHFHEVAYSRGAREFLRAHFANTCPTAPSLAREAILEAIVQSLMRQQFGEHYYWTTTAARLDSLRAYSDDAPLASLDSESRLIGAAAELERWAPAEMLSRLWLESVASKPCDAALLATMKAHAPSPENIQKWWDFWIEGTTPVSTTHVNSTHDDDEDGLPNGEEWLKGTSPIRVDTDGDGWSDLAETLERTDPLLAFSNPQMISIDGEMSDWIHLMPQRIRLDKEPPTAGCPAASDITFFTGLSDGRRLAFAGISRTSTERADTDAVTWEVWIDDVASDRQFRVTADGQHHGIWLFEVGSNVPLSFVPTAFASHGRGLEWVINSSQMALGDTTFDPNAVLIRLRTMMGTGEQTSLCDETPWFSPYISDHQ